MLFRSLNLGKCLNKSSINILNKYFDNIYRLSETLCKSVIKLNKKNPDISSTAFSRLKTLSTLRFNYYPNQNKPVEISKQDGVALGCETHVDSGVFTVLYQDRKGGLQVQNRKTKKWYDVPFNKKALVVNTGRALEFLSKGKFKATNHRVLWNKSKRLSIPFFFVFCISVFGWHFYSETERRLGTDRERERERRTKKRKEKKRKKGRIDMHLHLSISI